MTIHKPSVPNWKPYVKGAAIEVDGRFKRSDWTSTYPGHGEHSAKGAYAIDFMISNVNMGNDICDYLVANRKRLHIRYLIWNKRIINWGLDGDDAKWKRYFNAASTNPSKNHTNHIHCSFEVGTWEYISPAISKTYYATKTVKGYRDNGTLKVTRNKGFKIIGIVKTRSDGKYVVTRFGTWYPMDSVSLTKPV